MHNFSRSSLLMAAMCALFMACGWLIGGTGGMMIAFGIAAAMNFFAYWNADTLVLRMYRAQPVAPNSSFYQLVAKLAQNAGMPTPKVYIIDNPQPNAFATGRNPENASVAATSGLLTILDHREIAGVMAHELAHIRNRDTLTMTLTATLAGAISMLGNIAMFSGASHESEHRGISSNIGAILVMVVAPIAAMLVQLAISRTREYSADAVGAEICGDPQALASALHKIENAAHNIRNPQAEEAPATAQMFIINPLHGEGADNLFATHPSTRNRITRLMSLARNKASAATSTASSPVEGPWG